MKNKRLSVKPEELKRAASRKYPPLLSIAEEDFLWKGSIDEKIRKCPPLIGCAPGRFESDTDGDCE
jgi:hypothetical protein